MAKKDNVNGVAPDDLFDDLEETTVDEIAVDELLDEADASLEEPETDEQTEEELEADEEVLPTAQVMESEVIKKEEDIPNPFADSKLESEIAEPFFNELNDEVKDENGKMENYQELETPLSIFSATEKDQFMQWMNGVKNEPPAKIREMTHDLSAKMSWAMAFTVVSSFHRQQRMEAFVSEAENKMFHPENLKNFPAYGPEIQNLHAIALKSLNGEREFSRKFVTQNRDILELIRSTDPNPMVAEMVKLLSDLPPDRLLEFKEKIENEMF